MNNVIRNRTFSSLKKQPPKTPPRVAVVKGQRLFRLLSAKGVSGSKVLDVLGRYFCKSRLVNKKAELWSTIRQLCRVENFDHALQVMEWMEEKKFEYSDTDHSTRLDLITKSKGVVEAENYMNTLKPNEKNKFAYGSLLSCYSSNTCEHKALQLFSEMTQLGFITTALPFANLMSMYLKMERPKEVLSLEAEMKKRKISMSAHSYNLLMQSYAAMNDIEGVERVLERINSVDSYKIDWTTYSNLATIYMNAGLYKKAKVALRNLEERMTPGSRENFHVLMSLYAGIGEPDEVYRVWVSLKHVHPNFNNLSYLIMIQALIKLNDLVGMQKCFDEWQNGYSYHDMNVIVAVVSTYLRHNKYDKAVLVYEETLMRTKGPFINLREIFIYYFLENNFIDKALSYLLDNVFDAKKSKMHAVKPKLVSAFLGYFEKAKDVNGAEEVFKIFKRVYRPKSADYLQLLKVYVAAGEFYPEMESRLKKDRVEIIGPEFEDLLRRVCPTPK